ncbi:response regulator transcription factor [Niabella sp. CC-SYL272]|uniref:response regulator transcription factor n=1 Tax=Niabella agricola TaxID=2891571 RepID=UPI001F4415A2|nr:response regulator transcription factor [Niabella agricola]MCF3109612.1 response regulator transcription factor [Niabella agricola]
MESVTEIIFADDHIIYVDAMTYMINSTKDYRVTHKAANGQELLDVLRSLGPEDRSPDLCLLDINMPKMNGYEAMKLLSREFPDLPVLVLSMHDAAFSIGSMLQRGAKGFLTKGCRREELLEAFAYIREGDYYFSQDLVKTAVVASRQEIPGISPREAEFLSYCHQEMSYKEIADKMRVSERTVHTFRNNLFLKYDISSRNGLTAFAFEAGIISR